MVDQAISDMASDLRCYFLVSPANYRSGMMRIGFWILMECGDHYHDGRVVDNDGEYISVKLRPNKKEAPSAIFVYKKENIADNHGCFIFESEEELDAWLKYQNEYEDDDENRKPKIVEMFPKGKKKDK